MPELPEVETVRRGLEAQILDRPSIIEIAISPFQLRFPLSKKALIQLPSQQIHEVRRHGKYLFMVLDKGSLMSHLGMTGQWRSLVQNELEQSKPKAKNKYLPAKHDHFALILSSGKVLVFQDPRRFGWVEWIAGDLKEFLKDKGRDPILEDIEPRWFCTQLKSRSTAIKTLLLQQNLITGVGNIYASEILFRSNIRPAKLCKNLKRSDAEKLLRNIRVVLLEAIQAGGSSIRDYRDAEGNQGGYQKQHQVYGRENEACLACGTLIKSQVLTGRATYWCPLCQK